MSYEITEVLNDVEGMFTALVSFNGNPAERWETAKTDPKEIDAILTQVADDDAARTTVKAERTATIEAIAVKTGKIDVPIEK